MVIMPLVLLFSFIILFVAATSKIFQKAGEEGWKCIVPIYNVIVFLRIVGKPWWWLFLMCIPIINYIFIIWTFNMFSKSFGKDAGYTALLFFFGFIFFPVIAFGRAEYQGPYGDPEAFAAYQAAIKTPFDFEKGNIDNITNT